MHCWTRMVLKWYKSTVARCMVLQSIAINVKVYSGLGVLSSGMLTSVLGLGCPLVGLDGPVVCVGLPEDLVVLEAGTDGPVSTGEWSWKDLIPVGILLCLCEGIFLRGVGILWTWRAVLGTACSVGMTMPVLLSVILSVGMINLPQLLQGSHQYHLCHQMKCCHQFHLYWTLCCWGRVWTGCCR